MSDLDARIGKLSVQQRALLARKLAEGGGEFNCFPLSFAQRRLWFLDQLLPGHPLYNIPVSIRIAGPLAVERMRRSFMEIVRRHESLRTTFATIDGHPVQIVAPPMALSIPLVDLTVRPADERETEARRIVRDEVRRPFELERGPLLRVTIIRLAEDDHVLVVVMHHIVSDAWSNRILMRELVTIYDAPEGSSPLPELPIQYVDFAHWQRQWLQGDVLDRQLSYWSRQLAGASPVLDLPTDRPRPAVLSHRGATRQFALSDELSREVRQLTGRTMTTPFMVLLAALGIVLHRYTGKTDISIGSTIANRQRGETEGLIGFFANTLVYRLDLSGDPPFVDYLARVRSVALDAYDNQDLPFEVLVDRLQPSRELSHTPLFQVACVLDNARPHHVSVPGSAVKPFASKSFALKFFDAETQTAKFDLTLYFSEQRERFLGSLEYATDLFDGSTIERLIDHFRTVLQAIVVDPNRSLSALLLLPAAERHQLLTQWNDTAAAYPRERCLHDLFAAQATRVPDAVAVVYEDRQLSYGELEHRSNQLAHQLREFGVGPETVVGLCVERSLEMVVGLLGILKAGGAYLPLDPSYPQERIAYMLSDARCPVVVTQAILTEQLLQHDRSVVRLDADWAQIALQPASEPASGAGPDNLAYVIYTSGSTGKPKGVMSLHGGIVNRLLWMDHVYRLTPTDRILQKTPFSFDVSVWEFFWPLIRGARLVVTLPAGHLDPLYLASRIAAEQVTIVHFVPSMLRPFLAMVPAEQCTSLREVMCSGEALAADLVQAMLGSSCARVNNLYGPTEASVDVTMWHCTMRADGVVPIGRPIWNTQVHVLGGALELLPIGAVGDLYIGGAGLARGYLGRPGLTAEWFVPNPFGDGKRLYRTGDLARWRADGELEFLGRIDHQVKVHGFRIELGEIEAALLHHPTVRECVVAAREDVPSRRRLVAYVVRTAPLSESPQELHGFLRERLPDYMVPSKFVILDHLPLGPNGKVDRRALPPPNSLRPERDQPAIPPRTPAEQILVKIWSEVLGQERVGVNDNFFNLGGDSIIGIQVIARANVAGLQLTPRQIFQYPTITELAAVANTSSPIVAEQGMITGPVSLAPIQRWFFERQLPEPHYFNQSALFEVGETIEPALLDQAACLIAEHHDSLRLRFRENGGEWQSEITGDSARLATSYIDVSSIAGEEQHKALALNFERLKASLDLVDGPLARIAVFNRGAQPAYLFVTGHELVADTVSWRILLDDLQTVYAQLRRGGASELPPKTSSFKQWVESLTEYVRSAAFKSERTFWLDNIPGETSRLPRDFDGDNVEASARTVAISLSAEETPQLLRDLPSLYRAPIDAVLLAALARTFAAWTERSAILIDVESHGRHAVAGNLDLSRTVGWFTSIYPICLDIVGAKTPVDAVMAVKQQLARVPNEGIGYGLCRYLSADAELESALRIRPAPEVAYNYLGQFDGANRGSFALRMRAFTGPERSQRQPRSHLIEFNAWVVGGRFRAAFTYSAQVHSCATIERLANGFLAELRVLAEPRSEAPGPSTSDFPLIGLGQEQLDTLLTRLDDHRPEEFVP